MAYLSESHFKVVSPAKYSTGLYLEYCEGLWNRTLCSQSESETPSILQIIFPARFQYSKILRLISAHETIKQQEERASIMANMGIPCFVAHLIPSC